MDRHGLQLTVLLSTLLAFSLVPGVCRAQVEIEVDPLAYVLGGFSLHAATQLGSTRVNVGAFGIDVPEFFHGNEGWASRMRGVGLKWDYVGSSTDGWFAGLDAGYMRTRYERDDAGGPAYRDVVAGGLRGGYRLPVGGSGLYLSPWMSVSYSFDGPDVEVLGEVFERSPLLLFPTVHIGWRF